MSVAFAARCSLAVALTAVLTACGGSAPADQPPATTPPQAPIAQAPQTPQEAMAQAAQALKQMGQQTATAVDFEKLIELLPEAKGWTRGKPRGDQYSMGMTMSRARAQYEKGESQIDLEITDSSFNQLILSPLTMYLAAGFNERSSEGYKKSAPVNGSPGFEAWDTESKRAEITAVVNNRFIVTAKGTSVDNADAVRALVQSVDFSKLAALK